MTPRERVLSALRRQQGREVPYELTGFNRRARRQFVEAAGGKDEHAFFGAERHTGYLWLKASKLDRMARYLPYHRLPADAKPARGGQVRTGEFQIYEFGTVHLAGSDDAYDHYVPPAVMVESTRLEDFENYPMPDFDAPYRIEGMAEQARKLLDAGLCLVGPLETTIFEVAWQIRGYERLMMDFHENPDIADCLLDRITKLSVYRARQYARHGADLIRLGDDVGMEDRLMMSPAVWRRFLKGRLASVIAAARQEKPDILICYHSDGFVEPILGDLIEIGVDVLNPVQPECMDPAKLKRQYGDRLSFWGTIGIQHTLPFGTPADVEAEVRTRIETVGKGGGLLLSPTHVLAPEVPHENIRAMVAAMRKYGHC